MSSRDWGPQPASPVGWERTAFERLSGFLWSPLSALPPQLGKIARLMLLLAAFEFLNGIFDGISWVNEGLRATILLLIWSIWYDARLAVTDVAIRRLIDAVMFTATIQGALALFSLAIYRVDSRPAFVVLVLLEANLGRVLIVVSAALAYISYCQRTAERGTFFRIALGSLLGVLAVLLLTMNPDLASNWRLDQRERATEQQTADLARQVLEDIDRIDSRMQPLASWFLGLLAAAIFIWLIWRLARPVPTGSRFARLARFASDGGGQPEFEKLRLDGDKQLAEIQSEIARNSDASYLGRSVSTRKAVFAASESAALVIGPPRTGKTSGVILPSIAFAPGPVVSTSTKDELLNQLAGARSELGQVWHYNPFGDDRTPEGVKSLHWSPIVRAKTWDGALTTASRMVSASPIGGRDSSSGESSLHFRLRAESLLAALLYAAARKNLGKHADPRDLRRWILQSTTTEAERIVKEHELACDILTSVEGLEYRERSGVFSTAANVIGAFNSEKALETATNPNFDVDNFVRSKDTVFISASSQNQQQAAPLIVALLDEIKDATFRLHRTVADESRTLDRMHFVLDEVANIAPLPNLASIVSEAGGQGLHILAAIQDMSQARSQWGAEADGFLSMFTHKLMFPGITDHATLTAMERLSGSWDRPVPTTTRSGPEPGHSTSWSLQERPMLSISDLATIPTGHAVSFSGTTWQLVEVKPMVWAHE